MAKLALAHVVLFGLALPLAVPSVPAPAQTIQTVAGGGFPSPSSQFSLSTGLTEAVAVDSSGNLYISDATHGSVYSVNTNSGSVTVVAGNGTTGNTPVLQTPTGLAVDGTDHLFIADQAAGMVYEVATSGGAARVVAGCGSINNSSCPGPPSYGDGGKATSAFIQPASVTVDSSGNLFIADAGTCRVRKVNTTDGTISTVAGSTCPMMALTGPQAGDGGTATSAQLNAPQGVAVDSGGDIFIADTGDYLVREVCVSGATCGTIGTIRTVAGGGTEDVIMATNMFGAMVPATNVSLSQPRALALDPIGNLYIADFQLDLVLIVNISAPANDFVEGEPVPPGDIEIIAGTGSPPENIFNNSRNFNGPAGLALFGSALYIADSADFTIQYLDLLGHSRLLVGLVGNQTEDSFIGGKDPLSVQLATPLAVSEDANANIYLSETAADLHSPTIYPGQTPSRVLEAIPSRHAIKLIYSPPLPPTGLFLDRSDDLFVADGGLDEVSEAYGLVPVTVNPNGPSNSFPSFVGLTGDRADTLHLSGTTDTYTFLNTSYIVAYNPSSSILGNPTGVSAGGYPYDPIAMLGDGGPAQNALFGNITGLCTDKTGSLYVTDNVTNLVRVINTSQQATTIAGVTVPGNSIKTIAGGGGRLPRDPANHFDYGADQIGDEGPATEALISPQGCFVDNLGNVLIADGYNDRIRQVDGGSGKISTIAGSQFAGFSGDNGSPTSAKLNFPNATWGDQAGNLLISDSGNHRIREISGILPVPNASLSCQNCSLSNATGSNQTATVVLTNAGAAPLVMSAAPSLTETKDFNISGSTCPVHLPGLAPNASCNVTVVATGSVAASTNLVFDDNASQNNASPSNSPKPGPDAANMGQWSGYLQYSNPITITYLSATVNFDPLSLLFTAENVPQSIQVANTSLVPLTVSSVTVPAPFGPQTNPPSDSCGKVPFTVPANADCRIYIVFSPPASGGAGSNLAVVIRDNTNTGTQSIPLLGYALVPSGNTSFSISSGAPAPVSATFNMVNIPSSANVSPLCSVTPAGLDVTCSYNASNQTITATASIPSCVQTSEASNPAAGGDARYVSMGVIGLAMILPWGRWRRRRLLSLMGVAVLSYVVVGVSACSSTNQFSSSCVASVAPGTTFMLNVTANPQTAGQFPSLTLTTADVINVTK